MRKLFRKDKEKKKDGSSRQSIVVPGGTQPSTPAAPTAPVLYGQHTQQRAPYGPAPGEPFRSHGDNLVKNNDYNGAVTMYTAALQSAPQDAYLLLNRSLAFSLSTPPNLDGALEDVNIAIQFNPNNGQAWLQKGEICSQKGDFQAALHALTSAVNFCQGYEKLSAQRALTDARTRLQQSLQTSQSPPGPQTPQAPVPMMAAQSPQSTLPIRPPETAPPPAQQPAPHISSPQLPAPSSPPNAFSQPSSSPPVDTHSTQPPVTKASTSISPPTLAAQLSNISPPAAPSPSQPPAQTPPAPITTTPALPLTTQAPAPTTPASGSSPTQPPPSTAQAQSSATITSSTSTGQQAWPPPAQLPAPSPSFLPPVETTSSNDPVQPQRPGVNRPARPTTAATLHGLGDLLDLGENTPSEAPPAYAPNLNDPLQLQRQLDELEVALKTKNRGGLSLGPYTLPGQIDAIRLLYIGLTQAELTARELGTPIYIHAQHSMFNVSTLSYPGNTFLDMDCESSAHYEGRSPGTTTISGYSEEYRAHQLTLAPLMNLALEGNSVLPEVPMGEIVDRVRLLRTQPSLEDNVGLEGFLGLSQVDALTYGFAVGGSRKKQISYICMALTKSLYDCPARFMDFSKARFFSNNTLGRDGAGIGLRNFLYQILLGAELLIRLRKEPAGTNYTGLITDAISALVVVASLWMENVVIQGPRPLPASSAPSTLNKENQERLRQLSNDELLNADTQRQIESLIQAKAMPTTSNKNDPKAYSLYASRNQRQAEALIRFGEAMEWPYMDEARNYIENAYGDLIAARPVPSWDIYDWLFGLVLPGKVFRHRILACLVHSSPAVRSWGSAPYWENGLVVKDKSYWPRRTVLGRVLGAAKGVKSICGWVGPLPAPKEDVSGWVRLNARLVDVPVPVKASTTSQTTFSSLGFDDPTGNQENTVTFLSSITNPDEWIQAQAPLLNRAANPVPTIQLTEIHLAQLPLTTAPQSATASGLPLEEYRASLTFAIGSESVTYTLYSNPIFVAAPPCVGTHVIHRRQAAKYANNVIGVDKLKSKYAEQEELLVVDASGEGEEQVARAWCAERGRHAVIRKGTECCYSCAVSIAVGRTGISANMLILC